MEEVKKRGRQKGTPKTGGRQKGTPNKVSAPVKEWIAELIDANRERIEQDLYQVEPSERLRFIEKLLTYVVPKQQAVSATVHYDQLTEEQLDQIVNELTKDV